MKSSFITRSRVIIFFVIIFALIFLAKLFLVQIVHENSYREAADRQYVTPSSDIYERGTIYFANKDNSLVSAATQTSGFKMAINPGKIVNPENAFKQLSQIAPTIDHDDFITSASKENDTYEEVAHKLTQEQADAISALKLAGVSIFKEKWRFYPGDNLASHTIGLVGYKGNELGGRYGLERQYDTLLARNADNPYINFFAEVFFDVGQGIFGILRNIVKQLKSVNQRNKRLIERALRYSDGLLSLFSNATGYYQPTGLFEPIPNIQPTFSQRA